MISMKARNCAMPPLTIKTRRASTITRAVSRARSLDVLSIDVKSRTRALENRSNAVRYWE